LNPTKRTDDLFQLIKSLSKNERRYFRLFSGLQEGEKNYLELFDAMNKLGDYDEKQFAQKNKSAGFLKNLAWRKHHLYDTILSALEVYHKSADSEIYSLLHRAEILYEKTLYRQSLKALAKAKSLAMKNETFTLLLEVLRMEELNAIKLTDSAKQNEIAKEIAETHRLFSNAIEHKNMLNEVYALHHSTGFFRNKKDEEKIAHITKSKLWKNDSMAFTLKAKRYYYYARFIYHFMKGDHANGYEHCRKSAETFFVKPEQINLHPQIYLNALNALLFCCSSLQRYDEMIGFIQQFKESKKYFTKSHIGSAILLSYHELDYYSITGNIKDGATAAKQIEKELEQNEAALSSLEKTGLLINLSLMYFLNEKYRETLALLNRVVDEPVLDSRADMDGGVRIFYIIVHYERGANRAFMKALVRSAYRRLSKRKGLHKFENIILDFIRKRLIRVKNEEQMIAAFEELRKHLLKIKKDPYDSRPLEFFDLIAWLTAKIEGKKFAEVVVGGK